MLLESGYKSETAVFPTTHPSPFVRRVRLRRFVANSTPASEAVMRQLIADMTKLAITARLHEVRPHPIWLGRRCDYALFNSPLAHPR